MSTPSTLRLLHLLNRFQYIDPRRLVLKFGLGLRLQIDRVRRRRATQGRHPLTNDDHILHGREVDLESIISFVEESLILKQLFISA